MPPVIPLGRREQWSDWIESIQRATLSDIWTLIDPDGLNEPTPKPNPKTEPDMLASGYSKRGLLEFCAQMLVYMRVESRWERQEKELAKTRALIQATVHPSLYHHLDVTQPIRAWLLSLRASMKPTNAQEVKRWKTEYLRLTSYRYHEWPENGPEDWLWEFDTAIFKLTKLGSDFAQRWPWRLVKVWESVHGAMSIVDIRNLIIMGRRKDLVLSECSRDLIADYEYEDRENYEDEELEDYEDEELPDYEDEE
ncbi:hypothetical protein F5Y04DRAFT_284833 [Hypomontagnella monticulosa]|nr:hypothetical protein F5Y04DRAFT_284833 [Hypomontagnella monticulosa]